MQPNQHDTVMGASREATVVGEILLGLDPKFGIVAAREILFLGRMNIVSKFPQTRCDL